MDEAKKKILVVDDEADTVENLTRYLSRQGYHAQGAHSGEDALRILENQRIDLVLLDVNLPGIQGAEVAHTIKDKFPHTKIIVVTGHTEKNYEQLGFDIIQCLLKKPLNLDQIRQKIHDALASADTTTPPEKSVQARIIQMKAKICIVEPNHETFTHLDRYFKALTMKGELFSITHASSTQGLEQIVPQQRPDIFLVNKAAFNNDDQKILYDVLAKEIYLREIMTYEVKPDNQLTLAELERIARHIEVTCLMNGLIDVKWIEI